MGLTDEPPGWRVALPRFPLPPRPPFLPSPADLRDLALRAAPRVARRVAHLPALQVALDALMRLLARRHPGIFERLEDLGEDVILIAPDGLPWHVLLAPGCAPPRATLVRADDPVPADPPARATIRAPLPVLLDLVEGKIDGDALFFSRTLVISGDTEAVVMLRNAIESSEVDLVDDVAQLCGPLSRAAAPVLARLVALIREAAPGREAAQAAGHPA